MPSTSRVSLAQHTWAHWKRDVLTAQATDAQLAELAARDAVSIRGQSLRAADTGKEVIVWTEASGHFDGEAAVLDDVGSVEMGDAGGGFAGGGGDGGGGWIAHRPRR